MLKGSANITLVICRFDIVFNEELEQAPILASVWGRGILDVPMKTETENISQANAWNKIIVLAK